MAAKRPPPDAREVAPGTLPGAPDAGEMALDTLASMLRSMAEFALDQEGTDVRTFRQQAESWAQHVIMAAPAPGSSDDGRGRQGARRDWQGVRQFVREYCRSSAKHAASVATDLREVIWVFIRNFSQAFALDEETDERIRHQVLRLEKLVQASAASELKREALEAIGTLTRAFEERRERQRARMTSLGETVRTLGDELETARREGETDPLTRVFNRKAFDAYVERSVEIHRAFRQEMCLLVVDVDLFKGINDAYGHTAGDQVLREVANAIVRVFLRKGDFVARYGGDEFAVVLRETRLADALTLAERVLARVRAVKVAAGDGEIAFTVSMGAAPIAPGDDAKAWFDRADKGLYAAKSAGRARVATGPSGDP
jgi:diguanylate cyclase (GGDEF)-like protein